MDDHVASFSQSNETNQPTTVDEWKSDPNETSNNDNNLVKSFQDTTMNDNNNATGNVYTENQKSDYANFTNDRNAEISWFNQFNQKNHSSNKNNHPRHQKGQGGINKYNDSNSSFEISDLNNIQSNSGHVRGRGRGRGFVKRIDDENESFQSDYNYNNHGNNTMDHHGRGRGHHHRGRGGRFKENSNDGWYENKEDGHKKKENNKLTSLKVKKYIPPDIENEEFIAGIEAGLNFDKYETIEVKVSGTDPPKRLTSFHTSGLHHILLDNLSNCNFSVPTPVQNYAIPIIIAGRDLMSSAQTGSGKTVSIFCTNCSNYKFKKYIFFRLHMFYLFYMVY